VPRLAVPTLAITPEAWDYDLRPCTEHAGAHVVLLYHERIRFPQELVDVGGVPAITNKTVAAIRALPNGQASWDYDGDPSRVVITFTYHTERNQALSSVLGEVLLQYVTGAGVEKATSTLETLMGAFAGTQVHLLQNEDLLDPARQAKLSTLIERVAFGRFPRSVRVLARLAALPAFLLYRVRGGRFHSSLWTFTESALADAV
jgi:hypothetical protein